jgi:protein-disulfide isomerase
MLIRYLKKNLSKIIRLALLFIICLSIWACNKTANADDRDAQKFTSELEQQVIAIIRKNPEIILESVRDYQEKQEQSLKDAREEFVQSLKTNPQSIIGTSPYLGSQDNKIFLVEFSDFQCPYCANAQTVLKQFMGKHKDEVSFVYKHLPLTTIHPEAMPAAKAAWAAQQQGKFWGYHDFLFASQDKLGENLYLEIAQTLKLDLNKFKDDRGKAEIEINKDIALAKKIGIEGTPAIIMNDQYISGAVELSELEARLAAIKSSK